MGCIFNSKTKNACTISKFSTEQKKVNTSFNVHREPLYLIVE